MHRTRLTLLSGALVAGAAFAAVAAEPGETHGCASISDPTQRLACYDEAFGSPEPAAAASAATAPAAAATPVGETVTTGSVAGGQARGEEDFGFSEAELREREPDRARAEGPKSIEAVVTGIDYLRSRERVITLDNGQVWRETEVVTRARLAEGDRVTVKDAAMSSFRMVGPSGVGVRVRRVN